MFFSRILGTVFRNALFSHHHYFSKALVEDVHVFKAIFMVEVMDWKDFYISIRRNCLENLASHLCDLEK